MSDDEHDESGVVATFLLALLEDRARGERHGVLHYQALYPGYEAAIAREFNGLSAPVEASAGSSGGEPDSGRYRIEGEIGRGGMGIVYRALEPGLRRSLALKRLRAAASDRDRARFVEEARVTAQLDHPGIVPVHELGADADGRAWFTMPLVRGRTFADVIASLHGGDRLDFVGSAFRTALDVLVRVCEAVAFAHSRAVVHRDLKPSNVMVGPFGEVYVMDWGLAQVGRSESVADVAAPVGSDPDTDPDTAALTLAGEVVGTPHYMAPEQALGGTVDRRADVYAVGAMLYELVAGRAPFANAGERTSSREVLDRLAAGPPRPLREIARDVPNELAAICERAMARERSGRYATTEALREDLRNHLDGRVVRAFERGRWAELRKWIGRNRGITLAAAAAVLALAIGLFVSIAQSGRAQQEADRANLSFRASVDAVHAMLARVGNDALDEIPQATEVRRDLLADAVGFFDRFLRERPEDGHLRRRAANAHYQIAAIYERLGDHDAGSMAQARTLELWQAEFADDPDDAEARLMLAMSHQQAGAVALNADDRDAAERHLTRSRAILSPLMTPAADEAVLDLASSIENSLALLSYRGRDHAAVERHAGRAIELCRELIERFGEAHLARLGQAHNMLAATAAGRRDLAGTARQFEAAIGAFRRATAAGPYDYDARSGLALALRNLANTLRELDDDDGAVVALDEAIELGRTNVADFPNMPAMRLRLADALSRRAAAARTAGQAEAAVAFAREALLSAEQAARSVRSGREAESIVRAAREELDRSLQAAGRPATDAGR
ncbi:MAG: protein kinase [Planctomycetes bacterium]|nr:protein kinase [Planctomycetota bacterium]